jgi:protein TonB
VDEKIMVRLNNYGFLLSLLLHALILFMPVSMVVTKHFKEVKLFIFDERSALPVQEKTIKANPKEMPKEIIKEARHQPEIKEISEPKIVETAVITDHRDAPSLSPAPKHITQATAESPKIATTASRQLVDVEFGSANAPSFLYREMPVYPLMARRLGKEGRVLLRLTIDEHGKLLNVEIVEGAGYGFTEAAVEAVKKSTFKPAMQDGKPVMSKALLPIRFSLRRD